MAVLTKLEDRNNKSDSELIFLSYNSTGFNNQRSEFITDITHVLGNQKCFISVQEHFIMKRNVSKIEKLLPAHFTVYSVPAFKDDTQIKCGRGKGGLCQIWPKSLDHLFSRIPLKTTSRVQGLLITLPSSRLLWINCYFPCDPGLVGDINDEELQETLGGILWLMENTVADHILWNGDINTDFSRVNNTFVNM